MNDCFFLNSNGECRVLTVNKCSKDCRFRKTEAQYNSDIKKAEELLISKNLRVVVNYGMMTVEKIGDSK